MAKKNSETEEVEKLTMTTEVGGKYNNEECNEENTNDSEDTKTCSDKLSSTVNGSVKHWNDYLQTFATSKNDLLFHLTLNYNNQSLNLKLAALLYAHAGGVPIVASLSTSHSQGVGQAVARIFGLFHCKSCLKFWQKTNSAISSCQKDAYFMQGPVINLSIAEVINLVDALYWSEKFIARDAQHTFTKLSLAKSSKEIRRILKFKLKSDLFHSSSESLGSTNSKRSVKNRKCSSVASQANSLRYGIVAMHSDDQNVLNTVGIVGLHYENSFYPGFFLRKHIFRKESYEKDDEKSEATLKKNSKESDNELKYDFIFAAAKKIDNKGKITKVSRELGKKLSFRLLTETVKQEMWLGNREKPNCFLTSQTSDLNEMLDVKLLKKINKSRYIFGFKDGVELSLKKVFSSGLLYSLEKEQYFFAGLYDLKGNFYCSYAISWDGYFVPGGSDYSGIFVPFLKNCYDGNLIFESTSASTLKADEKMAVSRFLNMPCFPKSSKISLEKEWCCVKDGCCFTDNPYCITVFSDCSFSKHESLDIYIGGYMTSNDEYYLYGKVDEEQNFIPDGPPLKTKKKLCCFKKTGEYDDSVNLEFEKRFGIHLEENDLSSKCSKSCVKQPSCSEDEFDFTSSYIDDKSENITTLSTDKISSIHSIQSSLPLCMRSTEQIMPLCMRSTEQIMPQCQKERLRNHFEACNKLSVVEPEMNAYMSKCSNAFQNRFSRHNFKYFRNASGGQSIKIKRFYKDVIKRKNVNLLKNTKKTNLLPNITEQQSLHANKNTSKLVNFLNVKDGKSVLSASKSLAPVMDPAFAKTTPPVTQLDETASSSSESNESFQLINESKNSLPDVYPSVYHKESTLLEPIQNGFKLPPLF